MLTRSHVIKNTNRLGKHFFTWIFASILLSSFVVLTQNVPVFATYSITQEHSGLIVSDPLNNETETKQQVLADQSYWSYGGTAVTVKDTTFDIYKDSQGLHIGEPGPNDQQFGAGSYSGYMATSPITNGLLVHGILTATNDSITEYNFQNQIGVQTTNDNNVDYVECGAIKVTTGLSWFVEHGYGSGVEASNADELWTDNSANQPLTRDCTIVTNGQNMLKVYVDHVLVYSSNTLALDLGPPFNYYLSTMNSDSGVTHHGIFRDYYVTSGDSIVVTNNPSNAATVKLLDSSNNVLASASVTAGNATLDVGQYDFPLAATINVYDSNNSIIVSGNASIYGGDVYSVTGSSSGGTSPPSSPSDLTATATSSQVALSWSAPSSNGGSAITGYNIYRGTTSGGEGTTPIATVSGSTLTYTDTGLTNGQTYYYTVTATNSIGESTSSNETSATPASTAATPQPPTGLTSTATSSSQINLSWSAPSNNGGATITGYEIDRSTDSGSTWSTLVANTGTTATTYSDTGLTASTTYTYRVSAINSVGTSSPSNTASATTQASSSSAGITLNGIQSTSGTVSSSPYRLTLANFNAGTGNNRLLIVGVEANNNNVASVTFGGVPLTMKVQSFYNNDAELWYLTNPSGTGNIVVTMSGPTSSVVGAYSFSGVNQTSPLPTSATKHNTTPNSPSISITTKFQNSLVLDLPSIYGGSTLGSPSCTQSWDVNVPNAITGASSSTIVQSPGSVTCKWTASSGDLWDDAAIEIQASDSTGSTTLSNTTGSTSTAPQPPTGLTAAATSSSQINLSWSAPSNNGGSTITGYEIERSSNGGSTWSTLVANTASMNTSYSDTGLAASTTYTYRVSAINSVGTSSPSNDASATTSQNITTPQPPTGLAATAISSSQINLSWSAPSNNGGATITGYEIDRSTDGGSTWSTIVSNTGTTSTAYSNTGLTASTTYTYRVSAINSVGVSSPSNDASATTPLLSIGGLGVG